MAWSYPRAAWWNAQADIFADEAQTAVQRNQDADDFRKYAEQQARLFAEAQQPPPTSPQLRRRATGDVEGVYGPGPDELPAEGPNLTPESPFARAQQAPPDWTGGHGEASVQSGQTGSDTVEGPSSLPGKALSEGILGGLRAADRTARRIFPQARGIGMVGDALVAAAPTAAEIAAAMFPWEMEGARFKGIKPPQLSANDKIEAALNAMPPLAAVPAAAVYRAGAKPAAKAAAKLATKAKPVVEAAEGLLGKVKQATREAMGAPVSSAVGEGQVARESWQMPLQEFERQPLIRVVGEDFPATFLHGTKSRNVRTLAEASRPESARKAGTGNVILDATVGVEQNEFGAPLLLSEADRPQQALMFSQGRGYTLAAVDVKPGTKVLDLSDDATRAPTINFGAPEVLKFFRRPAITDDFVNWYLAKVSDGYKARNPDWAEKISAWMDPASSQFDIYTWRSNLLSYARDRGYGLVRFADETLVTDRSVLAGARKATVKEAAAAQQVRNDLTTSPSYSLFSDQPTGAVQAAHKRIVEQSLAEGKSVPPEVLAQYPDLLPSGTMGGLVAADESMPLAGKAKKATGETLPKELAGAKPRYSYGAKQFDLAFESDVDKALYIVAQKTPSKADAQYLAFLRPLFPDLDDAAIRALGADVRGRIKPLAKDAEGGATLRFPETMAPKAPRTPAAPPATEPIPEPPVPPSEARPPDLVPMPPGEPAALEIDEATILANLRTGARSGISEAESKEWLLALDKTPEEADRLIAAARAESTAPPTLPTVPPPPPPPPPTGPPSSLGKPSTGAPPLPPIGPTLSGVAVPGASPARPPELPLGRPFRAVPNEPQGKVEALPADTVEAAVVAQIRDILARDVPAAEVTRALLEAERALVAMGESPAKARQLIAMAKPTRPTAAARRPLWEQPIIDAERESAAAQAIGSGEPPPPPKLPSGRFPGDLGEPRRPYTEEVPGTATERALTHPKQTPGQAMDEGAGWLLRQSYDRFHPLRELDDLAGQQKDRGAHASAQVASGAFARGENNVRKYVTPVLDDLGGDVRDLERYMMLMAATDVRAKYPHASLPGRIISPERELQALASKLGSERMGQVDAAARRLWQLNEELRLKPLRDEGLLSQKRYQAIKADNPHYLPFDRYDYTSTDPELLLPHAPASVSGTGIVARTEAGSTKPLDQPLLRWMADIIHTQTTIARNQAARAIVEGLQAAEKLGQPFAIQVGDEAAMQRANLTGRTRERDTIAFFSPANPGVKQVANVPIVYATVAKGLEAEPAHALVSVMGALATPLRAGATTLNIGFLPVNTTRDLQNAWFKEGLHPFSEHYWRGWAAAIAKNTDFDNAAEAGVLMSGLLEQYRTTDALARVRQMGGIQVQSAKDAVLLLPRLVATTGRLMREGAEVSERATRIGTYLKLRDSGVVELEAAVRARDVTVDFSKSGNFVRALNQMVPFLNARLQGGVNTLSVIKQNPKRALLYAVPFATTSAFAWAWNARFETSTLIPAYEWERNWVFQFGEGQSDPDPKHPNKPAERFPIYVKVPKGDAGALLSAVPELLLRLAFQKGDRSVVEHFLMAAKQSIQGLSPVDPTASGLVGTLAGPVGGVTAGVLANRDFFRQRDIVPQGEMNRPPEERFGPETSQTAALLGQTFKVSPRLIDYALNGFTGALGRQSTWLLDLGLGALGYHVNPPGEALARPQTTAESLAKAPIASRFLGVRSTEPQIVQSQQFTKVLDETQRAYGQIPEIRRLGMTLGPVGDEIMGVPLQSTERSDYQRLTLAVIERLIPQAVSSPEYRVANPALQRKMLDTIVDRGHTLARQAMLGRIGVDEASRRRETNLPVAVGR